MGISKEPRVMIWGVSGGVGMRGCLEEGTCPYWETGLDVKIGHSIATVDRWCSQQGTPPGGLVRVRNVGTGRAGTFPLVLRRRSGARIGYRRDGPMGGCWVGVGWVLALREAQVAPTESLEDGTGSMSRLIASSIL